MTLSVDLTDVEPWQGGGTVLPPGEYLVEVTEAKESTSSGGHPQLELELSAIGGEHEGGTIRDWIVVIPSAAGRVKAVLLALGGEEENPNNEISFEAEQLTGKRCQIVVRNELYDGKERARVKAYEPAGAPPASNGASASDDSSLPF